MSKKRPPGNIFIQSLILLALLATVPGLVFAQDGSINIPENASAKGYGGGWECNRGYRVNKGACAAIKVPANAYTTDASYGRGWKCLRGYRQIAERCSAIRVPPNGYLDASGNKWKCNRGYRAVTVNLFSASTIRRLA